MDSIYSITNNTWFGTHHLKKFLAPYAEGVLKGELPRVEIDPETRKLLSNTITDYNPNRVGTTSIIRLNSEQYIGVFQLTTAIMQYDSWWWGTKGTITMGNQLTRWAHDTACIGLISDLDCPGSELAGIFTFADQLKNFPKPKKAFQRGLMCSGGLIVGVSHDEIIVDKNAGVSGSVGVQVTQVDTQPMYEKQGVVFHEFTADGSEEKNEVARELKKGNYQPLKDLEINPKFKQFQDWVKTCRPKVKKSALGGKEYLPEDAIKVGLVDRTGSFEDAIDAVIAAHKKQKNKIQINMSKQTIEIPSLSKVLGLESTEIKVDKSLLGTKSISLSVEQIESIETHLAAKNSEDSKTELTTVKASLETTKTALETEKTKYKDIETLVSTSLTNLKLEGKDSLTENITLLAEKVKEYGSKDGDDTTVIPPVTSTETTSKKPWKNPKNPIYNQYK